MRRPYSKVTHPPRVTSLVRFMWSATCDGSGGKPKDIFILHTCLQHSKHLTSTVSSIMQDNSKKRSHVQIFGVTADEINDQIGLKKRKYNVLGKKELGPVLLNLLAEGNSAFMNG